jgi:hypothetical protein
MLYTGDLSSVTTYTGDDLIPYKEWLESIGFKNVGGVSNVLLASSSGTPPPLTGKLVDEIDFHCEAMGDVTLTLVGIYDPGTGEAPTLTVMDTQIIHQIPEPMTLALLGLGGLFLRRRK